MGTPRVVTRYKCHRQKEKCVGYHEERWAKLCQVQGLFKSRSYEFCKSFFSLSSYLHFNSYSYSSSSSSFLTSLLPIPIRSPLLSKPISSHLLISLYLSPYFSPYLLISLFFSPYLSLLLFLSLPPSLLISLSLSLSPSFLISLSLSRSLFPYLSLLFSLSLSPSLLTSPILSYIYYFIIKLFRTIIPFSLFFYIQISFHIVPYLPYILHSLIIPYISLSLSFYILPTLILLLYDFLSCIFPSSPKFLSYYVPLFSIFSSVSRSFCCFHLNGPI